MKSLVPEIDEDLFYQEVGRIIRSERKSTSITQEELSKELNVSRTTITNIERGNQRIPLHLIYEMAIVLGIEIQRLMPDPDRIVSKRDNLSISIGDKKEDVEGKSADVIQKIQNKLAIRSSMTQDND